MSLTTVKNSKDLIQKINAKSLQYFKNVILPELLTHRLDSSVENNKKHYCLSQKLSFRNMIACDKLKCKFD